MRKRSRGAGSRRRALLGVASMLVFLALSLAALAARQVASESRGYLEARERELRRHVEVMLSHLERAEQSALDELVLASASEDSDLRKAESRLPLVDRAFHLVDGRLTWPPPLERARYGSELAVDEAGTPLSNRLLDRAYRLIADGDTDRALQAFEHILERKLPPSTRAEALLQMATILQSDDERRDEAAECFDRVLALADETGAARASLLPWTLAAGYRKAVVLVGGPDQAAGVDALLELAEQIAEQSLPSESGEFTTFYLDRSLERLSSLSEEGALSPEQARRHGELSRLAIEQREDAAFRRELEALWLPALGVHEAEGEDRPRRVVRETERGPSLLVLRRTTGDAGGVVGMRVNLNEYGTLVLDHLRTADGASTENAGPTVLTPSGELLFGEENPLGGAEAESLLRCELGGGLPWFVALPVSRDLRRFQVGRSLLYGGLAMILVVVVTIASLTTLRGMQRAVELADLKAEFVANVSHELKTPLTLIRMYADLLSLGYTKEPEEAQDNLKLIARETENLSLLIDNVLDLSRIDAGEKEYHPEPADLPALIRRGVDGYRPYLERRGFTALVNLPPEFPRIEVDQSAFSRALNNLLSNSVKYSGDRREVEVNLRLEESGALVEVADRGLGLKPGEADRVFDRFFRGGRSDAASSKAGTGIGLAIVRHIVESHGGHVYAAPREGGGSRFSMRFPVTGSGATDGERA